jgi:uroporphyrinogen-III decarboxylase
MTGGMTPRERYLCALNLDLPDRLPATTIGWMTYHLKHYLNGMTALEAYEHFSLEACIDVSWGATLPVDTPQWRVETTERKVGDVTKTDVTVTTPEGKLQCQLESNQYTGWLTKHPIKELEQIRLIDKYWPAPRIDIERVKAVRSKVGESGVVQGEPLGWRQPGPWQDACEWVGTERMILETFDHPGWVHEFMEILTRKRMETIESMRGAPYDKMLTGGGAASSTVISPSLHEEYCLPYDRRIHDALHDLGFKISYHTCGGMMPILEIIASNGCDCMEPFAPRGIGGDADLAEAKGRIGDRICIKGGIDQIHVLEEGTPELIRETVLRAFEDAGTDGGFIISMSDHFFNAPLENLWVYANTVHECTY